jgi:hypothetical protein
LKEVKLRVNITLCHGNCTEDIGSPVRGSLACLQSALGLRIRIFEMGFKISGNLGYLHLHLACRKLFLKWNLKSVEIWDTYISGMEPGNTVAVNDRFATEFELLNNNVDIFN